MISPYVASKFAVRGHSVCWYTLASYQVPVEFSQTPGTTAAELGQHNPYVPRLINRDLRRYCTKNSGAWRPILMQLFLLVTVDGKSELLSNSAPNFEAIVSRCRAQSSLGLRQLVLKTVQVSALKRIGHPEEVAVRVSFIAGSNPSHFTGERCCTQLRKPSYFLPETKPNSEH